LSQGIDRFESHEQFRALNQRYYGSIGKVTWGLSFKKTDCIIWCLNIASWQLLCPWYTPPGFLGQNHHNKITRSTIFARFSLIDFWLFTELKNLWWVKDFWTLLTFNDLRGPLWKAWTVTHLNFLDRFLEDTQISHFMKIRPAGAELFYAYGRTDGNNEVNIRFSQFCESASKWGGWI
jgi:hypothetical protein